MIYQDAIKVIEAIENENYEPNDWEADFIEGITDRWTDLTEKQTDCLNNIYAKATGGGKFQKREYFK